MNHILKTTKPVFGALQREILMKKNHGKGSAIGFVGAGNRDSH